MKYQKKIEPHLIRLRCEFPDGTTKMEYHVIDENGFIVIHQKLREAQFYLKYIQSHQHKSL